MTFDANNNLLEADDGGVFRRVNPQANGRLDPTDPFESPAASNNKWVSVNGNLQVAEYFSVGYDPNGKASFGSETNIGFARQLAGGGNLPPDAGGTAWGIDGGNTGTLGDAGRVFTYRVAVDTLSQSRATPSGTTSSSARCTTATTTC